MTPLRPELTARLAALYPGARAETLPADASTRRFHRLFVVDGGTRIVMDYGHPFQGETDDIRLARIFERAELPVARVLAALPEVGALVLEDLGNETLEAALAPAASGHHPARDVLYRSAVLLAVDIATRGTEELGRSERAQGPALDGERLLFEMHFFLEHYVGNFLGRPQAAEGVRMAVEQLALTVASHPRVMCHRDYHSRNLMVRPDGALAMVDIQDARWGPDTYDLASLVRDAYADVGESEVDHLFELYRRSLPGSRGAAELRSRLETTAAQRMIKALGTFGYQVAVCGRDRYRTAIPRTVERLSRLLPSRVETEQLADVFLRHGVLSS